MNVTNTYFWLITILSNVQKKVFNVPQKSGWSALNNNDWHALKIESSLAGDDCGDQPAALLYSRYPERW